MWHEIAAGILGLLVGGVLGFWQGKYHERKKNLPVAEKKLK